MKDARLDQNPNSFLYFLRKKSSLKVFRRLFSILLNDYRLVIKDSLPNLQMKRGLWDHAEYLQDLKKPYFARPVSAWRLAQFLIP